MNLTGQIFRASGSTITIEAAEASSGSKTPRFTMTAYTGAPIRQLFAEEPIVVDLEGMTIPDRAIPIRLGHDSADGKLQLVASGVVSRATEAARDVIESGKNGFPWQASIGASIERFEIVKAGATVTVNGRELTGPLVIARETTLGEISFVDLGADSDTHARIAASQRATGPGANTMNNDQNRGSEPNDAIEPNTTNPTINASGGAIDDLRAKAEAAKVDAERQAKIKASAERALEARPDQADQILQLAEQAIADKVDPSDFGVQMLRFARDFPGIGGPRIDRAPSGEMLEAAMLLEIGIDEDEVAKDYGEKVVEASRKKFGGGIGINEAVSIAANAGGLSIGRVKRGNIADALVAAFDPRNQIQAASTISLPSILSNVANKVSMSAFNAVESSWQAIAAIASLNDFKQHTTNALVGDFKLKQLGASGDIEHAVPGEQTYTNQVNTFARMLEITRRDIINDDTNALLEAPRKLGRGAALAFNDTFWTEFLDDASFFSASNTNLMSGAISALDVDSLTSAVVLLMSQTDPDGNPLGLTMGDLVLLVPPALSQTAYQLANSTEIRGASGTFGTANPHKGNFTVVVSQYLTSSTAWYVLAKPSVMPVMQAGFLNGKRRPTIESAEADFNNMGIRIRVYHDFGAAKWEYRGGVKAVGA